MQSPLSTFGFKSYSSCRGMPCAAAMSKQPPPLPSIVYTALQLLRGESMQMEAPATRVVHVFGGLMRERK